MSANVLIFGCRWEQLRVGKEPAQQMKGMAIWEAGGGGDRRHFLLLCS